MTKQDKQEGLKYKKNPQVLFTNYSLLYIT